MEKSHVKYVIILFIIMKMEHSPTKKAFDASVLVYVIVMAIAFAIGLHI